jgi:hypothetical protein
VKGLALDIGKRLAETALASRSPAYRWLEKHRAEIFPVLAGQARPSWKALSETAALDGETFRPDALRKAWLRLEHDRARAEAARRQPDPPVVKPRKAAAPSPPVGRMLSAPDTATPDQDRPQIIEPGSRFRFTPAVDRAKPPKKES